MSKKQLLSAKEIEVILQRLAAQLLENHLDFTDTVIIGLQPRGIFLANRLNRILKNGYGIKDLKTGHLDITFYRDDFRRKDKTFMPEPTILPYKIENRKVVLIDDVLFTGRSIRAALTAIQAWGRPKKIELLTLIDRRFSRHLPIQPDYTGRRVDAINHEKVKVKWQENDGNDGVYLIKSKP